MNAEAQAQPAEPLALVVFGRDESGKAHGSAFTAGDAELATKAAELMGMRALTVRTDIESALAAKLPRGRVFASGKAFVPFIKATLLTELQTAALNSGLTPLAAVSRAAAGNASKPADAAAAKAESASKPAKQPTGWENIEVGAIVLATYTPDTAEWYESVVLAVEGSDTFSLRYCDFPKLPPFTRKRGEVALIHPTYPLALPLDPESPAAVA